MMRQRVALLLGLLTGSLVGCLTGRPVRPTALLERFNPFHGPTGADVVQLDVAILECPVGDRYINRDLWALADEQIIALERQAVLEDNGFRIGQVGGILPPELQALLSSERHCALARRLQLHANHPTTIVLGPPQSSCRFELHQDGRLIPVTLEEAQCTLQVVPFLTPNGRIRLHFTPQIPHGAKRLLPLPAADHSGLILWEQRPTEDYPALSWDVTLATNQYMVVGTRCDRRGTLGYQSFLCVEEPKPVQRLLVICGGKLNQGLGTEIAVETGEAQAAFWRSPPLALQASWTTVRGSRQ